MSGWTGATQGLQQVLAARELRKRQMLLDTLQVRDKQRGWEADTVRAAQQDRALDQVEKNQGLLREQARIQQQMLDEERNRNFALKAYENQAPTEDAGRKAFELQESQGLSGVIEKRPGQVLRLGAASNVGPIETPGGAIAMGRDVQKDDTFPSQGGTRWQEARAKADEQLQLEIQRETARAADRGEQRDWMEQQNEFNRQNARLIASMRIEASRDEPPSETTIRTVLEHPEVLPMLAPKERSALIKAGIMDRGFSAFGKPLSDTALTAFSDMADGQSSATQLDKLLQTPGTERLIGPYWKGTLMAMVPNSPAERLQGAFGQVRQSVGKLMEGGVLREYDEKKYQSMLPNENSSAATNAFRLNWLRGQMKKEWDTYLALQKAGGRNVGQVETLQIPDAPVPSLRTGKVAPPIVAPGGTAPAPAAAAPPGPPPGATIWRVDPQTGQMVKVPAR